MGCSFVLYLALSILLTFNDLVEWESFAEMLTFLKMQLFAVLRQHIEDGKTSLAANHTLEMRVKLQYSGLVYEKYDTLFHSSKLKEFKLHFTILCKVLELKSSNDRDILLEGTQQLVRTKEKFELYRFELMKAIYESLLGNFYGSKKLVRIKERFEL